MNKAMEKRNAFYVKYDERRHYGQVVEGVHRVLNGSGIPEEEVTLRDFGNYNTILFKYSGARDLGFVEKEARNIDHVVDFYWEKMVRMASKNGMGAGQEKA